MEDSRNPSKNSLMFIGFLRKKPIVADNGEVLNMTTGHDFLGKTMVKLWPTTGGARLWARCQNDIISNGARVLLRCVAVQRGSCEPFCVTGHRFEEPNGFSNFFFSFFQLIQSI